MSRAQDPSPGFSRLVAWTKAKLTPRLSGTAVLLWTTAVSASAQQPATTAPLVFDGVTVVDVERGKLLPAQRVVITGDRITAMGSADAVKRPGRARVVDARGKYLIPGLWDMHVHPRRSATEVFYPLFVANGVTGIRDAWSSVPLDTLIQWRREIVAGARVGPPRQILSGSMIQSYCPILYGCVALDPDVDSAQLAARAGHIVDSLKAAGIDMIKMRDLYPATTYFVIAAAARRAGVPFGGHTWDSIDVAASDSGARIIDHMEPWYDVPAGLRIWCWASKPTASIDKCRPVAQRFRRNGTWIVPTMTVYVGRSAQTRRTHALARQLRRRAAEFLGGASLHGNWIHDSTSSTTAAPADAEAAETEDGEADGKILPDSLGVLRLMARTDLPIVAGTDASSSIFDRVPPGFSLHTELAIYVAEGLTSLQALQSATLEPARLLHATDSLGTVAPGKLADLVLLDANPLTDITNTTTIRAVVANGRYYDRAELDRLLTDARARAQEVSEEP